MANHSEVLAAERAKDGAALRQALSTEQVPAPVLVRLLLEDWHDLHEDIVVELGLLGEPSAVGAILKAISIPFGHLVEWGNLHEFQRKCAYALARIGTEESREALEMLARSTDPYIRQYGEECLPKWPLPYRG
jgi:HEAT repeat protein